MRLFTLIFLFTIGCQSVVAQKCDKPTLEGLAKDAEIIFVGQVEKVDPSWGWWSGVAPNVQVVRYKIVNVLKGKHAADNITVGHLVVKNSLTADSSRAQLSPLIFSLGKEVLVFAKRMDKDDVENFGDIGHDSFLSVSENCGAISIESINAKVVRRTKRLLHFEHK